MSKPMIRAFAVATCATLAGCGGLSRLDPNAAHTVNLAGAWVLDRAASDDPQKLLEQLRPKINTRRSGMPDGGGSGGDDTGQSSGPPSGGPAGGGGTRGGRSGRGAGAQQSTTRSYRNDSLVRVPVMQLLKSYMARGDQFTIRQSDDEFAIDYGNSVRKFTPGGKSVVSAEWGVADQVSGWKGKQYIIEVKPQQGVPVVETYGLSEDGKKLIQHLRIGGGDYPVVQLNRLYDHADKPLPRSLPTND